MHKYIWTTLFIVGFCAALLVAKVLGAYTEMQIPMGSAVVGLTNTAPDVGAIDVYIDRSRVIEDLHMSDPMVYMRLTPGKHLIDVIPAGENIILIKTTEMAFEAGHTYQVTLVGLEADWSVKLVAKDKPTI